MKRRPSCPTFELAPRAYDVPQFMWLDSSATSDQIVDQLTTMHRLETTTYATCDYLYQSGSPYYWVAPAQVPQQEQPHEKTKHHNFHHEDHSSSLWMDALYVVGPSPPSPASVSKGQSHSHSHHYKKTRKSSYHSSINEKTRQYMVDLLYEIADYCHFRRETVAYAVRNLLDRYLSCPQHAPLESYVDLQLVASAALYIAVKVLEPVSMDVVSLADLSRGAFDARAIVEMERTLLTTLAWNVAHGPTPVAFCQHFLALLQLEGLGKNMSQGDDNDECDWELLDNLLEHAQYQVELAVSSYQLGTQRHSSEVALAAVMNALEAQLVDVVVQVPTTSAQTATTTTTAAAYYWEERLWQYLATAGWDVPTVQQHISKVRLTLCKLQYNAQQLPSQPSEQSPKSQPQQDTIQEETSSLENPHDQPPKEDLTSNNSSMASLEETERDDDDEDHHQQSSSLVYPSPISVVTTNNAASLSSSNKNHHDTEVGGGEVVVAASAYDSYYNLAFLKRLFFP
mgnify:CR=1 FL=1